MRLFLTLTFFIGILFANAVVVAQSHVAIRRIVVFPLQVESSYKSLSEEIWWDLRAKLTESKRFLVASRNFMQAKGVFQARGRLESADAIILGRLLDANAMITIELNDRILTLRAYEGKAGYLLWDRSLELHPSIPLSKQLPGASEKLLLDFLVSVPYQCVVVTDSLVGKPLIKQGEHWLVKVEVGVDSKVKIGDPAQVIDVKLVSLESAFGKGSQIQVQGEGQVVSVDGQTVTIQLNRLTDPGLVKDGTLVKLPDELQRLQETFSAGARDSMPEVSLVGNERALTAEQAKRKPMITSLSFLANLILMLVVAL